MSSDSAKRSLKPPPQRTPLTSRSAGNNHANSTLPAVRLSAPRLPATRPATSSPRLKSYDGVQLSDASTFTPQSTMAMKRAKVGTATSPEETRMGGGGSLSSRPRMGRPRTAMSDNPGISPPVLRSPGHADAGSLPAIDSIDSRFFHASDVQRQEPKPKKPEPKKVPTFFYADGKEDSVAVPPRAPSPVLSAVSDKRSSAPWIKPDTQPVVPRSPPILSPSLATTASSPFFPSTASPYSQLRSPSPSKENIHLSYRKGASQIFGMRPIPAAAVSPPKANVQSDASEPRQPSLAPFHQKSPSLSSIDSGNSHGSRRRSATAVDPAVSTSPLLQELKHIDVPPARGEAPSLPSIDTSLSPPEVVGSPPQATLSPTKHAFDVAADARRERKVLDLEISNSSLLAINASLEREVRRQKAELKRFRRLSRAGRFSIPINDMARRSSAGSDAYDDGDETDNADDSFGLASPGDLDESSDSDEEDGLLGTGHVGLSGQTEREQNRLAKDEKRLRVDLERHKELLVQSQAMNQSLKRCMLATEDMIRDGRKALEYCVRVSDVKLGGRILTGHEDEDTIEVEDDITDAEEGMESARGLLDVWRGVGKPVFEGSEGSADRDSGIEVDKMFVGGHNLVPGTSTRAQDFGRPPEPGPTMNDLERQPSGTLHSYAA